MLFLDRMFIDEVVALDFSLLQAPSVSLVRVSSVFKIGLFYIIPVPVCADSKNLLLPVANSGITQIVTSPWP
jgi:hypothetical protein